MYVFSLILSFKFLDKVFLEGVLLEGKIWGSKIIRGYMAFF